MRIQCIRAVLCIFIFSSPVALVADDYYIQWADTIDYGNIDEAFGVAVDHFNNIIVTGVSDKGIPYMCNEDYLTVKYDSSGNILWLDTLGTETFACAQDVAVDNSDNIIVTGFSQVAVDSNAWITVKYDSCGNILWVDTLGYADCCEAYGVATDNSNNIIVTGLFNFDYLTVKYDASGNIHWADTLDNGGYDYAYSVATDNFNNIIVTGASNVSDNYNYFTVKYDSAGNILWADTIDNGETDVAHDVIVDNSDNIIVTGYSSFPGNVLDYFTVKYDPYGNVLWTRQAHIGTDDIAEGIAVDTSGNIVVTGAIYTYLNEDYYTVKYDSSGNILWTGSIDNTYYDHAYDVAVDYSGNIIVTGNSVISGTDDYFTVKYAPVQSISEKSGFDVLDSQISCDIYPNPAVNRSVIIKYEIPSVSKVEIKIYDVAGSLVRVLENRDRRSCYHTVYWDTKDNYNEKLPSGVYIIRLETGKYSAQRKVLLIR
jgi:hypothetical protein